MHAALAARRNGSYSKTGMAGTGAQVAPPQFSILRDQFRAAIAASTQGPQMASLASIQPAAAASTDMPS